MYIQIFSKQKPKNLHGRKKKIWKLEKLVPPTLSTNTTQTTVFPIIYLFIKVLNRHIECVINGWVVIEYQMKSCYLHYAYMSYRLFPQLSTRVREGSVVQPRSRQWAGDSSIFGVVAVVDIPGDVRAVQQKGFCAIALQIVQLNYSPPSPKKSFYLGRWGLPTAQLATHHLSIGEIPGIITHSSPRRV